MPKKARTVAKRKANTVKRKRAAKVVNPFPDKRVPRP
jgi:hypothetical protein